MLRIPLALLLAFAFPQDGESLDPSKVYEVHDVRGWTVYVEDQLVAQDELASEVLALLSSKLREVVVVLPKDVIERLQQVPIRLHLDRPGCPGGVYHPSSVWLKNHGLDPQWARGIEFGNAQNFLSWMSVQPSMVLHELSHAWHHQVLTYEHEGIREAYLDAVASTEWENVRYARGGTKRAYALNNPQEYFAEITEAYFGFNDFFPFVRGELLVFDPQGAELLAKVWAKVPEKTFIRPASGRRSSSINGR